MRFGIDGAAWPNEGRDVGDGVSEPECASRPGLQVKRLIEVPRTRRVDGYEGDVREIGVGKSRSGD
jgi:hypothetical protein